MVAERRLLVLERHAKRLSDPKAPRRWLAALQALKIDGLPVTDSGPPPRPGVVSLHDPSLTADDWIALRTTRSSLRDLEAAFDFSQANVQPTRLWRLLMPNGNALVAFDESLKNVGELSIDLSGGYICWGGVEVPANGLVWRRRDSDQNVVVPPSVES